MIRGHKQHTSLSWLLLGAKHAGIVGRSYIGGERVTFPIGPSISFFCASVCLKKNPSAHCVCVVSESCGLYHRLSSFCGISFFPYRVTEIERNICWKQAFTFYKSKEQTSKRFERQGVIHSSLTRLPSPAPLSMDGILTTEADVWMTSSEFCPTGDSFFSVFTSL